MVVAFHFNMNVDVHLFIACRAPAIMPFSSVLVCICEYAMPKHSIFCGPNRYFHFNMYVPSFLPSLAIFYFKSFSLPLKGSDVLNTVCHFSCKKNRRKPYSIVIICAEAQFFSYPWILFSLPDRIALIEFVWVRRVVGGNRQRLLNGDRGAMTQYRLSFLGQADPICCVFIKQMAGDLHCVSRKKTNNVSSILVDLSSIGSDLNKSNFDNILQTKSVSCAMCEAQFTQKSLSWPTEPDVKSVKFQIMWIPIEITRFCCANSQDNITDMNGSEAHYRFCNWILFFAWFMKK